MADLINDGWLWLNNGVNTLKLACREVLWDDELDPKITDYAGGGSYGFDLGVNPLYWKARGVVFTSADDYALAKSTIKAWQAAGTFTLEVVRDTSDNKVKCDGTNTSFTVLCTGFRREGKLAAANGTIYQMGILSFRKAG